MSYWLSRTILYQLDWEASGLPILLAFAAFLILAPPTAANQEPILPTKYEEPRFLTGTIFDTRSEPRKVLFKFTRSATRSGSVVRVLREFQSPDGELVARERVVYESDRLASYAVEELQQGSRGLAVVRPGLSTGRQGKLDFEYITGNGAETRRKFTNSEILEKDVLINDMIPPFILSHWNDLMRGSTERFRLIVLPRVETIQFKLEKESEATNQGKAVIRFKMAPVNFLTAQLIEPILFTVESQSPHRILQYTGRTTPRSKSGSKWKDLDALTVFDWK